MGDADQARGALEKDWEWWRGTMASRKADPSQFRRVGIMQRLHESDISARCIEEGYTLLSLPMRFETERRCVTRWGGDRRTVEGELLCPGRFDESTVAATERDMGSQVAAAQLQQRPSPAKGLIFERDWLAHEWRELPASGTYVQSWDCTFKDLSTSDYVAGQVWMVSGPRFYLVDRVKARMNFPATKQAIRDMASRHPKAMTILVEDKANGSAVIQELTTELSGLIAVTPQGGKVARANAVSPLFEAGNVFVPALSRAPWVAEWREEMATFPMGRHDDDVDTTTQALIYLRAHDVSDYIAAIRLASARR
jgi:predicted phage terminase large subunit-like protein